ncbi:MAG TPA: PQQ-dependent sugar dehydrogenase, partial [Bryobacteraceae bacterium]|nr:PQQ-dependent sugar dehydrogenase [Bryobacteraceae bacterium]
MRILLTAALFGSLAFGQVPELRLQRIASGFQNPTAIAPLPDMSGDMLVLEQAGRVRLIRNGVVSAQPVITLTDIMSGGEKGLLGIAFPPGLNAKRYFYLSFTDAQGHSRVSRFRLNADGTRADLSSEEKILTITRTRANHNGGGIEF